VKDLKKEVRGREAPMPFKARRTCHPTCTTTSPSSLISLFYYFGNWHLPSPCPATTVATPSNFYVCFVCNISVQFTTPKVNSNFCYDFI